MAIRDLMALARVRRLLLEMGREFIPAAHGEALTEHASLEQRMHTTHGGLEGLTPMQMFDLPGGEARVGRLLAEMLGAEGSVAGNGAGWRRSDGRRSDRSEARLSSARVFDILFTVFTVTRSRVLSCSTSPRWRRPMEIR